LGTGGQLIIPPRFLLRRQSHTAVMSPRNDFPLSSLAERDFGSVVAVDGDALEDGEEIALKLLVPVVRNRISVTATPGTLGGNGFVHGAEQGDLLRGRSIDEILSEELVALLVDTGETAEKLLA